MNRSPSLDAVCKRLSNLYWDAEKAYLKNRAVNRRIICFMEEVQAIKEVLEHMKAEKQKKHVHCDEPARQKHAQSASSKRD